MKFNFLSKRIKRAVNHEGAQSFSMTPAMELYAAVATAALSDSFYEKNQDRLTRIRALINQVDPEFVARLAVYARTRMNMRSIPMVLAVELAKQQSGHSLVSKAVAGVVKRADEITELLAYYELANERKGTKKLNKLSKQVQKGLSVAFNSFDEYQFAKYNKQTAIKLRDALFIVHPKAANEDQQLLFNKIAGDVLAVPYTWETELSALGQQKFDTAEARALAVRNKWEELIESGKLGYMALLRNLRNILEANVSVYHIKQVCAQLENKDAVAKSKQLPFRFLAAFRELKSVKSVDVARVMYSLELAIRASVQNIKGFDDTTRVLIACDVSGSMQQPVSPKSKVMLYDIGLVLGMLLQSKCSRVISGMFGDSWKIINMPSNQVLANVDEYYKREGEVGYSTNGYKVLDDLINRKQVVDKLMFFTDCQLWDSTGRQINFQDKWKVYKKIAPNAVLYLFDLQGYGQVPLRLAANQVYLIAGWSDKVFDVLDSIERGEDALMQIQQVSL